MATTTAFPSLSVPVPEDTMEMSSPGPLSHDDDIDLDFGGDYESEGQLQEDEQMLVDGEQTRPPTATDASMDDDMQPAQTVVEEAQMQDEPIEEDDELIDYDDDVYSTQPQPEDTVVEDFAAQQSPAEELEQVDEGVVREAEDTVVGEEPGTFNVDGLVLAEVADVSQHPDEKNISHIDETVTAVPSPKHGEHHAGLVKGDRAEAAEEVAGEQANAAAEQPSFYDGQTLQAPISLDVSVASAIDVPGTPTDTGLHPVTLYFEDLEMPLFKSKRQQDGLLKDDNLASLSLAQLLSRCRQRLGTKLDRNIPEERDLVLSFDQMGLILVENSRCTFQSSLNDVLEVHLQLHHNDGVHDVPPLALTLTQQFKFSSNLAMLKQRAESGEGVPRLEIQEPSEGDDQDFYQDDDGETGDLDQAAMIQEYGSQEDNDHHPVPETEGYEEADHPYEDRDDEEQRDSPVDGTDCAGDPEHYKDEYAHYDNSAAEAASGTDHPARAQSNEEGVVKLSLGDGLGDHAGDATQAAEGTEDYEETALTNEGADEQVRKAESATSSQIVQGDVATDTAEPGTDVHDDFSTLLTEYEAEETQAAQDGLKDAVAIAELGDDDAHHPGVADTTHTDSQDDHTAVGEQAAQSEVLGSEEVLAELDDQQVDGTTFVDDTGEQGGEEAEHYTQHEDQYDQADIFDEQQEQDNQPGEETEQFYTACDLLESQEHEHGPEYDTNADYHQGEEATDGQGDMHHHGGEDQLDPEDDLVFDDETTEQHEARKASQPHIPAIGSGSPLGKRSFEEHAEVEDLFDDEPDSKKVRFE